VDRRETQFDRRRVKVTDTAVVEQVAYSLREERYHWLIERVDGSTVFRLLHKDRKLAEEILHNLVNGLRWEDGRGSPSSAS
jgi:hypothetical protein